MKKTEIRKKTVFLVLVLYGGSMTLAALYYHHKASEMRDRAVHIADGMEHLLSFLESSDPHFSVERIREREDVIDVQEFPASAGDFARKGQHAYTVTFRDLKFRESKKLDRYFAETVLGNYYSLVVDKSGKIVDFFWDKP